MRDALRLSILLCSLALLAGCGGSEQAKDPAKQVPAESRGAVAGAQEVDPAQFPAVDGRSLDELASEFDTGSGIQAVMASSVFRPGENRIAFGVLDPELKFVYGDTVVYVQGETGPVRGPYPAPADVLLTEPRYRSKQAASEQDPFAAVYEAIVPIAKTGVTNVLVVTDRGEKGRIAAQVDFEVVSRAEDKIPDVGEPAPKVPTDTIASLKGDVELADTREPPAEELHRVSFAEVVGKQPVALLFATPQLCQSRVCGPVVDIALQQRARYGEQVEFIHQEVFAGNDPAKGLREPLQRFRLETEPWLFVVGRDGRVTARLEGSFGLRAFERAIKSAL